MGTLALIAEFENDIRRERQMDGIKKARERGIRFGRKPLLISETIQKVRKSPGSARSISSRDARRRSSFTPSPHPLRPTRRTAWNFSTV
jgi:DNA invertase Pin-like site-specific DNA recombinase